MHFARDCREGKLEPFKGWLSSDSEYYHTITLYTLSTPLAIFKLMNYRLTLFDLNLVPSFKNQYFIAKALYRSFLHDYKLAAICPKIEYNPDDSKIPKEEKEKHPEIYYRQGINSGVLDIRE